MKRLPFGTKMICLPPPLRIFRIPYLVLMTLPPPLWAVPPCICPSVRFNLARWSYCSSCWKHRNRCVYYDKFQSRWKEQGVKTINSFQRTSISMFSSALTKFKSFYLINVVACITCYRSSSQCCEGVTDFQFKQMFHLYGYVTRAFP